jgi:hypothetical protein
MGVPRTTFLDWLAARGAVNLWRAASEREDHELMARLRRRFAQQHPARQRIRVVAASAFRDLI